MLSKGKHETKGSKRGKVCPFYEDGFCVADLKRVTIQRRYMFFPRKVEVTNEEHKQTFCFGGYKTCDYYPENEEKGAEN